MPFKLAVVGGPAKGKSYQLKEVGENSVGRIEGNDVVLASQKVSKKHCVLVVSNGVVTVKDAGSSNGTFVNGILTKAKPLKPGDRVSVGEHVLELVKVDPPKPRQNNVIPINGGAMPMGMPAGGGAMPGAGMGAGMPNTAAPPQNLQEKIKFLFETHVLNFVYNLNEKHEWHVIMMGMFGVLTVAASVFSVYSVMDRADEKLTDEARNRALVLARQMVDRNAPYIYERQESKMNIDYVEKEPGVMSAYIIDMDQRVLAPGKMLNQSVNGASEGVFAAGVAKKFYDNEQLERLYKTYGDMVAAAVPLRIFSQSAGKNVTVAVGMVFYDRTTVVFDSGTEAMAYIQAILVSAIIAVVMYFALLRLTLRPLQYLNEQIDFVLKGNGQAVEKKFKMEEINPLIDIINTALQRAAQAGPASMAVNTADEVLETLKFTAARMAPGSGLAIFNGEKKIVHWSAYMVEITGIQAETAIGSDVNSVARDAAFGMFVEDLFSKAPFAGSEPVGDDFEFSGVSYHLDVLATGSPGSVKYYVITIKKPE
ncbi:MAG: FHA domain-containing protein [Deltaproteobacteria bacterium]|nr:FHA domain-containing protein [Deltaproteobacteria bacterium]